jgi:hypothetical protein
MDIIHDVVHSEGLKNTLGWRESIVDQSIWLVSRSLLIVFIVWLAFSIRLPFQRLIGGEAIHEMEEAEKEKQLQEFRLVQQLSIAAAKFQPTFNDSANAIIRYQQTRTAESRNVAEAKLHQARVDLDRFHDSFGNRTILLKDDLETSITTLIDDAEAGLRVQNDLLQAVSSSKQFKSPLTFGCNKTMIEKDVEGIVNYEVTYVSAKRRSEL